MSIAKSKSPKYPTWPQLKQEFEGRQITYCEEHGYSCPNGFLTPAHKFKRSYYRIHPELLWTFEHVIIICLKLHQQIEQSKKETEQLFARLRP